MEKIKFKGKASHWSPSDFYIEVEAALRELLIKGTAFETEWLPCRKEIASAKITRKVMDGPVEVEVYTSIDKGYNLIDDATPDDTELTEAQADEVYDLMWNDNEFTTDITCAGILYGNPSYGAVCDLIDQKWEEGNRFLDQQYRKVKEWVKLVAENEQNDSEKGE